MAKAASNSLTYTLLALIASGVMVSKGVTSYNVLKLKANEQASVTEAVIRWKRSFRALAGTQEQWEKSYQPASQIRDQLALINLLNLQQYGLSADTDTLVLQTSTAVTSNNVDLALTKLCLATGGDNFIVEAANYDALLSGIRGLARRADIGIGEISILGEKAVPQAKLGNLCVFLRSE